MYCHTLNSNTLNKMLDNNEFLKKGKPASKQAIKPATVCGQIIPWNQVPKFVKMKNIAVEAILTPIILRKLALDFRNKPNKITTKKLP